MFSSLSFAIAAAAFLAAAIWALSSPSRSAEGFPFRLAALLGSAFWGLLLVPPDHGPDWPLLPFVELARYGLWLLALPTLSGVAPGAWFRRLNLVLWILCGIAAFLSPVVAALLLAFAGLFNVEQLLRNAQPAERRGVTFCVLSLGGMFAYDLFFYSGYALLGAPDTQAWSLRGVVNAALLPLLVLGVSRLAAQTPVLFVSRHVVFYSTAFVAVGLYLLVIATAAAYLGDNAGSWGPWLRPLLLIASLLVLAALLLADTPWRRLRVFLSKHFYRNKYDYRLEWLRLVRTLENAGRDEAEVASIRAIAEVFESPGGALFLRDDTAGGYSAVARWSATGNELPQPPLVQFDQDMIRFMENKEWVIDLDEYHASPAVYQWMQLPGFLTQPEARWRIVSPLFEQERLLGFLVLQRPQGEFHMTYEDRDLLRMVGRHVATLLARQAAERRLTEGRQFDAFNRLSAFVMHDLKNAAAQLQLVASNAARHRSNPQFIDDALETVGQSAARIMRLVEQLRSTAAAAPLRNVDLAGVVDAAIRRCSAQPPEVDVQLETPSPFVRADPDRLATVLEHILRNAQDAAGRTGTVRVVVETSGRVAQVAIHDSGPGMDANFIRERLFRPFDTTKGSRGMGIGAYQAREYVLQLGGSVEVQSTAGVGTRFIIRIPLCPNSNAS
jgi:putative PEP-CTERM system histidine kinase